ncbi:MAG: metal-dependent transcriptional regulator [Promethearchaeota archaeon]
MLDIDFQILKIIYRTNGNARLKHVQEEIKATRDIKIPLSTINSCIERLEKKELVEWIRYSPLKLTEKGMDLAKELIRHAQLLEVLLYNELELSAEEAHFESEKFNLLFSCNTINKICEKYDHPLECPCGDTILSSFNCYCEKE